MSTILYHLIRTLRSVADYNVNDQTKPVCILWTDATGEWHKIIPTLQNHLKELYVLGEYKPEQRQGPAVWLRCVLAGVLTDGNAPSEKEVPIFYLPQISYQNLRAVETCADTIKPLVELQYRGKVWLQETNKDWTIVAFFKTRSGLGLEMRQDEATEQALQISLDHLLNVPIKNLQGKHLTSDYLYRLLIPDLEKTLLSWLQNETHYQAQHSPSIWQALNALCQEEYGFRPIETGGVYALQKLATQDAKWDKLWERYRDVPQQYTGIHEQLRQLMPSKREADWDDPLTTRYLRYPKWNEWQETRLRASLEAIVDQPLAEAQKNLCALEEQHGHRRETLWANLGEAPLAQALEHLKTLAQISHDFPLNGGTLDDLAERYQQEGWKADDAVLRALEHVKQATDVQLIESLIHALYEPWGSASAHYLQGLVKRVGYPAKFDFTHSAPDYPNGTCILFVDALRYDVARRLSGVLEANGLQISITAQWSALPSVTATAKPSVSPMRQQFSGEPFSEDFEPIIHKTGKPANSDNHLKLLAQEGWQVLDSVSVGDVKGRAWTEIKSLDDAGHQGAISAYLVNILNGIQQRVQDLLAGGWRCVRIVTDHGWLFLPNGLPKTPLATSLTHIKGGRCASLKEGSHTDERSYSWFWNPQQYFVLADGISSFWAGNTYVHGGLSLQECLTPELVICTPTGATHAATQITKVEWRGLRCSVYVEGGSSDDKMDIRTIATQSSTSVVENPKPLKPNDKMSLVIPDDDLMQSKAYLVIINAQGDVVAQQMITIGGDEA